MPATPVTMTDAQKEKGRELIAMCEQLVTLADPAQKANLSRRFKAGTFLLTFADGKLTQIDFEQTDADTI